MYVPYGTTSCPACQTSTVDALVPGSADPACANHVDRRAAQACARCGAFACHECLRAGDEGAPWCNSCYQRSPPDLLAWDRRRELGLLRAFFRTAWATISAPRSTFAAARSEGTVLSSLGFATLACAVAYVPTFVVYAVIIGLSMLSRPDAPQGGTAIVVGVFAGYAVFTPLLGVITTFVFAGIDHLVLRLFGVSGTFATTLRASSLSLGPYLFGVIPICSIYVLPFWVLAVRIFAFEGLHRTTTGKAAAGALVSSGVCCVGAGGLMALVFINDLSR